MTTTTFGKYQIVEKVGAGGFGEVFKGLDPMLNRHVAIKTCSSDEDDLRRRFLREAEIAARLQHPNIVTVFDFGFHGETPYLVQEFLSGEDLDHKIKRRDPLSLETKLYYLSKVADGLRYAHSQEVIHRDVKPANVRVLADGQVRVMDFGIAKLMTAETQLTRTGMALGTAAYLPPEQLLGRPLDPRADQFSFGVLAYELMTWKRPFTGDSMSTILYAIAHTEPEAITKRWPGCPPRLATVIETCLAKDPQRRYPGFAEVIVELEAISGSLAASAAVPAVPASPPGGQTAGTLVPQATDSPPAHAPPPVPVPPPVSKPVLMETVAINGQAATQHLVGDPSGRHLVGDPSGRRSAGSQDGDKAARTSRKLMMALVAAALVIVAGLAAGFLAKRFVDGRQTQIADTETTPEPAPPPPVVVPEPEPEPGEQANDETEDEAPVELPGTADVELEPAPEEPATARDRRPQPAPVPRSSPGTTAESSGRSSGTTPAAGSDAEAEASVPEAAPEPTVPEPDLEQVPLIVSKSYGLEPGRVAPGQKVYADRDFVYGTVPGEYLDLPSLKTPNNLRRDASALTFTLSRPAEVFVAHDQRITRKPDWLAAFRKTGQVVTVDEGGERRAVTYDVYVRGYRAGVVKFGSSAPPRQRKKHRISMYLVFLRPG